MKVAKLKNYLDEVIWHVTCNCPGCGNHQEQTLYSQRAADNMRTQVEAGTYRCGVCVAERGGHNSYKLKSREPERWQKGSYSEKMRSGSDNRRDERTET